MRKSGKLVALVLGLAVLVGVFGVGVALAANHTPITTSPDDSRGSSIGDEQWLECLTRVATGKTEAQMRGELEDPRADLEERQAERLQAHRGNRGVL
jgi:hypothetical protein